MFPQLHAGVVSGLSSGSEGFAGYAMEVSAGNVREPPLRFESSKLKEMLWRPSI